MEFTPYAAVFGGVIVLGAPTVLSALALGPWPGPQTGSAEDAEGERDGQIRRILVGMAVGLGLVPTFAFFFHLLTHVRVSWWTVSASSLLTSAVALLVAARREREGAPGVGLLGCISLVLKRLRGAGAVLRGTARVLGPSGLIGLIYVLKYDTSGAAVNSCMSRAAFISTGILGFTDILRQNISDARLGAPGVLAAYLALFDGHAFRVLFFAFGVMMALGGYLLGRSLAGRTGAILGLLLIPLNPYVLAFPRIDENLVALAFSAALIPFVTAPRAGWALPGALFGLVVIVRHVFVPALGGWAVLAYHQRDRRRAVATFLAGFVAMTLLENLHHHFALGSVFRFESNSQFPPFDYHVLGRHLRWEGEVNWPLHDHIVRTPHNPFPMFALWPLHIADHLGTLIFATMLVGFVVLFRRSRKDALFWAFWALPIIAGLSLQESWDYANKLGIMSTIFVSMAAWTIAGVAFVARSPKLGAPIVLLLAVALVGGARALRPWRAPADERYYAAAPAAALEMPSRVEEAAEKASDLGLLPDLRRLDTFGPFLHPNKLVELGHELGEPPRIGSDPWGWFPHEPPPQGEPITVELDLSRPFGDDPSLLRLSDQPPDLDLVDGPGAARIEGMIVPWDPRPLILLATNGAPEGRRGDQRSVPAVAIFFEDPPRTLVVSGKREFEPLDKMRCSSMNLFSGVRFDCQKAQALNHPSPVLRLRLRSGALSVALAWNPAAWRADIRKAILSPAGVTIGRRIEPWLN